MPPGRRATARRAGRARRTQMPLSRVLSFTSALAWPAGSAARATLPAPAPRSRPYWCPAQQPRDRRQPLARLRADLIRLVFSSSPAPGLRGEPGQWARRRRATYLPAIAAFDDAAARPHELLLASLASLASNVGHLDLMVTRQSGAVTAFGVAVDLPDERIAKRAAGPGVRERTVRL